MKYILTSSLVASCVLPLASATPGTIQMGISKDRKTAALQRRGGGTVQATLNQPSSKLQYNVDLQVGTPGQTITVQVDTGSSDVWFPDSSACVKLSSGGTSCDGGSFVHSASSTFVDLGSGFSITYGDGTGANGDYFNDSLSLGGVTLKSFEMGLALDSSTNYGLIGIGYDSNEGNVDTGGVAKHPGFVDALVSGGFISTTAYSLWLDDLQASTGSILFGGIDTAKYTGNLIAVDVYPSPSRPGTNITEFLVALTSVSITSSSGTDQLTPASYAVGVVLDSGSTVMTIPSDLVTLIYQEFGAKNSSEFGEGIVPCSTAQKSGTLNFGFGGTGGPTIKVPWSELVDPVLLTSGATAVDSTGKPICSLGIQAQDPSSTNSLILGDTFLRSAYVVYDTFNNQIGLAQTVFNTTSSNVVAFPSLGAAIPSASVAPGQASITPAAAAPAAKVSPLNAAAGLQSAAGRGVEPSSLLQLVGFSALTGLMALGGGMFILV